jgi:protein SCO1/2
MRSLFIVASLLAAACTPETGPTQETAPAGCILDPPATIGGDIALTDHTGAKVTEARFSGAPTLLYFGFTYCPDICPLSMQTAKESLAALGPQGATIQTALISLDPERDTPAQMASYIASDVFPAGLVGLTGTKEETAAAAKAFRVAWRRNDDPGSAAGYLIDHSSFFYLLGPDWRTLALFPSNMPPVEAARCMGAALAKSSP